jgi:stage II sporulation protein R
MMKKHLIRLGVILILSVSIFATLALLPVSEGDSGEARQLQEGVVRFHVIAKSDQTVDQELKLDVRDAVLDYLRPSLEGVEDQQGAAAVIQDKLPEIEQVAVKTLRSQGCSDPVEAYFGIFDFPVRVYGPLTFPEGKYQSLRIVLGEGEGKNWWCCLFPPLCYVDLTSSAQELEKRAVNSDGAQLELEDEKKAELEKPEEQQKSVLLIDSVSESEENLRLTTKIGEWLDESQDGSLLSWLFSEQN